MRSRMQSVRSRKGSIATMAVLGVLAVVGVVGVGFAAIPGSDGTIKGCYATTNGLLLGIPYSKGDTRIVDAGEPCRSYEQAVTWNQQGQPGTPGTNGTNGTNGVSGWERILVNGTGHATAKCPAGKVLLGGGGTVLGVINAQSALVSSAPLDDTQWQASAVDQTRTVQATALCASVTG